MNIVSWTAKQKVLNDWIFLITGEFIFDIKCICCLVTFVIQFYYWYREVYHSLFFFYLFKCLKQIAHWWYKGRQKLGLVAMIILFTHQLSLIDGCINASVVMNSQMSLQNGVKVRQFILQNQYKTYNYKWCQINPLFFITYMYHFILDHRGFKWLFTLDCYLSFHMLYK